jgi:threonine dehydratase
VSPGKSIDVAGHLMPAYCGGSAATTFLRLEQIAQAQQALWSTLRIAAEPGGAAALAALLSRRFEVRAGSRIAVVASGGNTSAVNFK